MTGFLTINYKPDTPLCGMRTVSDRKVGKIIKYSEWTAKEIAKMKGVSPSLKRVTVLNDPCEESFRTKQQTLATSLLIK